MGLFIVDCHEGAINNNDIFTLNEFKDHPEVANGAVDRYHA